MEENYTNQIQKEINYANAAPSGRVSYLRENTYYPAEFYEDKKLLGHESKLKKRKVFAPIDMVRVFMPGGDTLEVPASETYQERYPMQWEQYKKGRPQIADGTPIEYWHHELLSPAMIANLKSLNIQTVEGVATMPDGLLNEVGMGARNLKDSAAKWVDSHSDRKREDSLNEVEHQLGEERKKNQALEERLARLEALVDPEAVQVDAPKKPRRKRRTKAQMEEARAASEAAA
jgi:hypothetical protein